MANRNRDVNIEINAHESASDKAAAVAAAFEKFEQRLKSTSGTLSELSRAVAQSNDAALAPMQAKLDAASKSLNDLARSSAGSRAELTGLSKDSRKAGDDIESGLTKAGNRLGVIEQALQKMQGIPVIGRGIGQLSGLFGAASEAASGAGVAASAAWGPVVLIIGAATAAIGVFVAAAKMGADALQATIEYAEQIDDIQDVTGMAAESVSALVTEGERLGITSQEMGDALKFFSRNLDEAAQAADKLAKDRVAAQEKASRQIAQLEMQLARKQADTWAEYRQKKGDLDDAEIDRAVAFADRRTEIAQDLTKRLADIESALKDRLAELADAQQARETKLQRDVAEAEADMARQRTERQRVFTVGLGDLAESHAERLAEIGRTSRDVEIGYQREIAQAAQDFDRRRRESAEDLRLRLGEMAESHAQQVRDLERSIDDLRASFADNQAERVRRLAEQESERARRLAEQQEQLDERNKQKRLSLLENISAAGDEFQERALRAELEAFDQQAEQEKAKLAEKAAAEKAEADRKAAEAEAAAKAELDRRIALVQERIARENAEYEKQTAKVQAEEARRVAAETERHVLALANDKEEHDARLAQLAERLTKENGEFDKRSQRMRDDLAREAAEAEASHQRRLAQLGEQGRAEQAEYEKQTAKFKAEQAKRSQDERDAAAERLADARKARDEQIADYRTAQARMLAETQARVQAEKTAVDEQIKAVGAALEQQLSTMAQSPALNIFQRLGLDAQALKDMKPDEALARVAAKLNESNDAGFRVNTQMTLLGRTGSKMNDLLESLGENGMNGLLAAANAKQLIFDQNTLQSAKDVANLKREVDQFAESVKIAAGKELLPLAKEVLQSLKDLWDKHGDKILEFVRLTAQIVAKIGVPTVQATAAVADSAMSGNAASFFQLGVMTNPINLVANWLARLLEGRAGGGPVLGNTPYLVGERGPELFVPNAAGTIVPNQRSTTINLTANYPHQSERTVRDDVRLLQLLYGGA